MNRTKGLALALGVATLIVVGLACGAGEKQVPSEMGPASDSPQAQGQPGPSGSPGEDSSPVVSEGSPRASLTYEGLAYYQDPLRTDEAAGINENNLELVGSTMESNTLAPGTGETLNIYKLRDREDGYRYTLRPGLSFQNEDGDTITIEAEWIRWTAADSNQ